MERIQALIDKLFQQKEQNASPAQLLATVQILQSELMRLQQKNGSLGTSKVSVTMPTNLNFAEEIVRPTQEIISAKETTPPIAEPKEIYVLREDEQQEDYVLQQTTIKKEPLNIKPKPEPIPQAHTNYIPAFDQFEEAPTLTQYQPKKEIHEVIADQKESLNDKLKQEKTELAHVLKDSPIKDLRKAIGINDRFTFVSELFRGDEAMYERSIKTINGFNILSEAEYWMNRELKFKLGWNDNKELVQHFYQLVRRRFS